MATCPFSTPTSIKHNHAPPPVYRCATSITNPTTLCISSFYKITIHRPFPFKRNSRWSCCHATSPQSEPPSEKSLAPISGVKSTFTRFQDTLQIFFAVLFWLSLFFWSSAWDGGDGGRWNKGSRFKK
ncbi:hypothetical protein CASFOL_026031 [Castilleja foliolosa]|uniref:Uncharacterized protein n=1 Tax=Castilleja foliolosa TaxID=1961234 RepID=A0ABD3CWT6_9LAMI